MGIYQGDSIYNNGGGGGGGGGDGWEDVSSKIQSVPGFVLMADAKLYYNSSADLYYLNVKALDTRNFDNQTVYNIVFKENIILDRIYKAQKIWSSRDLIEPVGDMIITNENIASNNWDFAQDRFRFMAQNKSNSVFCTLSIELYFRALHE